MYRIFLFIVAILLLFAYQKELTPDGYVISNLILIAMLTIDSRLENISDKLNKP